MRIKVLKELQEYIYSLKGDNGLWRKIPVGVIGRANTSEENLERLKIIINLLLASDKLSDDAKIYISNRKISVKATNDILNDARQIASEKLGKTIRSISYQSTVNRINEDEQGLIETLGVTFFKDLVYGTSVSDKEFSQRLTKLIKKYGVYEKQRNNLNFYIDASVVSCDKYKGNEEFFDILSTLECYLTQHRDMLEEQINSNKEFIGYFNYLLSAKSLTDPIISKDRERLLNFLSGNLYREIESDVIEDSNNTEVDTEQVEVDTEQVEVDTENEELNFDFDDVEEVTEINSTVVDDNACVSEITDDTQDEYADDIDPELLVEDCFLDMTGDINTDIDREQAINKFTFKPKSE